MCECHGRDASEAHLDRNEFVFICGLSCRTHVLNEHASLEATRTALCRGDDF